MKLRGLKTLSAVTIVYFVVLAIFATFWLAGSDMAPFDSQFFGYNFDQAQMYLDDLSGEQVALLRGVFRVADTIFPALLALTLLLWFRRWTQGGVRLGLTLLTALYLAADYTENMLVGRLLSQGADRITLRGVETASLFTMGKWALLIGCFSALLILCWRNREGKST